MSINIKRLYTEESSVINTDTYDRMQFEQMVNSATRLEESVEKMAKENLLNVSLIGDIWGSLYKMKPLLKSQLNPIHTESQVSGDLLHQIIEQEGLQAAEPSQTVNEELISRILSDENYLKMHNTTRLDEFSSSLGAMRLSEVIQEWNDEQRKQDEDFNKQMQQLKQIQKEIQSNNQAIEKRQDKGQAPTKGQAQKQGQLQQQLQATQQDLAGQVNQKMGDSTMSDMLQKATEQTNKEKESVKSLLGGSGASNGDAELKKLPLGDQLQLANLLRDNENVRKIAEWAGKFKSVARKKQKSKHIETVDRSGMTLGNDVERLLPQELGQFMKEGTRLDFLRRYAEDQTMMYSPKGKEVLGKGPIVICLDESGSMSTMINQAKGFSLALAMIAKKQRRDFCVIPFSVKTGEKVVCEKGKVTTAHILQLANSFLSGGTHYMPVLNEAVEYIQSQKRFKNADIIFVTDGDPSDTGAIEKQLVPFLALKEKQSIKIMSLLIGDNTSDHYAKKFSNTVIRSNDFTSADAAEIFKI